LISDIKNLVPETKLSTPLTLGRVFHCPTGLTSEALLLRLKTRHPPAGIALNGVELQCQKTENNFCWNINDTIQPENRLSVRFDAQAVLFREPLPPLNVEDSDKISPGSLSDGVKPSMNVSHDQANTSEYALLEIALLEIDDQ
jgi:hypothetical protein